MIECHDKNDSSVKDSIILNLNLSAYQISKEKENENWVF